MAYRLTDLLQDAWYRMGQMKRWTATGGSATTLVNSAWAGVEEQIYDDDDPALIYGTAVVIQDTNGVAPEGEMGRITDYDSSSQTLTFDAITAAIASGDKVGIASPLFPLEDMITAANLAIQRLGEIDIPDTSLSVVAGQTEYTLPSAIRKYPIAVNIQTVQESANNRWVPVPQYDIIPATTGSNWTLVIPQAEANFTLQIVYRGLHPKLTAFNSPVLDTIHPELAVCAVLAEAYQWYNNQVGGTNQYFLQRENKALQDLEAAKISFAIPHEAEQIPGFPHWGVSGDYVPGTSDLKA